MTAKQRGKGRADSKLEERSKHIETCHVIVSWPDPRASTPAHSHAAEQDGGAGGAGGLGGRVHATQAALAPLASSVAMRLAEE